MPHGQSRGVSMMGKVHRQLWTVFLVSCVSVCRHVVLKAIALLRFLAKQAVFAVLAPLRYWRAHAVRGLLMTVECSHVPTEPASDSERCVE